MGKLPKLGSLLGEPGGYWDNIVWGSLMKFLLWQTLCQTCRATVVAHCVPNHCLCYYLPVSHLICLCSCVTVYVLQCVTIWETRGVTSSDHNAPLHHRLVPHQWPLSKTPSRQCYNVTMCYSVLQYGNWLSRQWLRLQATARQSAHAVQNYNKCKTQKSKKRICM